MEDVTIKAIVIGVNIFVTLTILTIIIIMFSQMGQIYGIVATTDNSISSTFDNVYAMYDGRTMTGLGLLNTVKKYEGNTKPKVVVAYPGHATVKEHVLNNGTIRESVYLKQLMEIDSSYHYETKYNVSVDMIDEITAVIIFEEK